MTSSLAKADFLTYEPKKTIKMSMMGKNPNIIAAKDGPLTNEMMSPATNVARPNIMLENFSPIEFPMIEKLSPIKVGSCSILIASKKPIS